MKVLFGPRQSGRTGKLIREASMSGKVIVVHSRDLARQMNIKARQRGIIMAPQ